MTPKEAYWLSVDDPFRFKKRKDYYESRIALCKFHSLIYSKKLLFNRFEKGEYSIIQDTVYFKKFYITRLTTSNKTHIYYKFI